MAFFRPARMGSHDDMAWQARGLQRRGGRRGGNTELHCYTSIIHQPGNNDAYVYSSSPIGSYTSAWVGVMVVHSYDSSFIPSDPFLPFWNKRPPVLQEVVASWGVAWQPYLAFSIVARLGMIKNCPSIVHCS